MQHRLAVLALTLLLPLAARAGAPMATEDADVLARGECEWESTAQRDTVAGLSGHTLATKAGCGVFEGTQAALGVSRARFEGARATGLGLSGKTALIARPEGGFGLTLAWGFGWAKAEGEGLRYAATSAALVATQGVGALTLHANFGLTKPRGEDTLRNWALGAEYALSEHTDLLAETYGVEHGKPLWGLGLRVKTSKDWTLGLMAAQSRETPRLRSWLASAKLAF